jgi:hypothetical protein
MPSFSYRRLLVPSLVDVFFCVLMLAAFLRPSGLQALLVDGDTGWHIRTGELVLSAGHVPRVDPFSFTRAGQPWFAWEWASDVIFALLWRWKGVAAVAGFCGVILALSAALLFARLMARGVGLAVALALAMAAVSASSIHYLARPHVFSILFYGVGLWVVELDRERPDWRVWLLVPMTALWANLHAGFIAWCVTLAVVVVVEARKRRYLVLASACALATLCNPYGWRLHAHVAEYLNSRWIMDHVQEFQSPNIRTEGMVVYAVLLLSAVALAARAERLESVLVLLWGFASLRSARHVPLFALVAAPVVACAASEAWGWAAGRLGGRSAVAVLREFAIDLGAKPRLSLWLGVSALGAMVVLPSADFPDSRFPVAAVESNLPALGGGSRVLTSDQWADYLIYRMYPRQRSFFDGRSDFFGPELGGDYRKLFAAESGWRELLERYGFEMAILPHDWPLSTMLDREPGWRRLYGDAVAVVFVREGGVGGKTARSSEWQGRKAIVAARPERVVEFDRWHEDVGRPGGPPHKTHSGSPV